MEFSGVSQLRNKCWEPAVEEETIKHCMWTGKEAKGVRILEVLAEQLRRSAPLIASRRTLQEGVLGGMQIPCPCSASTWK